MVLGEDAGDDPALPLRRKRGCEPCAGGARDAMAAHRRLGVRLGEVDVLVGELEPRVEILDVGASPGDPARRDDALGLPGGEAAVAALEPGALPLVARRDQERVFECERRFAERGRRPEAERDELEPAVQAESGERAEPDAADALLAKEVACSADQACLTASAATNCAVTFRVR